MATIAPTSDAAPPATRDLIAERAATDPAWLLVLAQYDDGLTAYPDPFQHRSPA